MIKLVALDLDDTLLNSKLEISPETADAIRDAVKSGTVVTLATGRMYRSALPYALELGLDVPLVTYHGALVKTSLSNEVLYHRPVPKELAAMIIGHCQNRGFDLNMYLDDELYAQRGNRHVQQYKAIARVPLHEVEDLITAVEIDPDKLMVIDEEAKLDDLALSLREMVGASLHITKSKPFFLEITHPQGTKGQALSSLAARLGINRGEIMAVGDSYNDLDMIEYAGVGVAMGNARPEVKAKADFITLGNEEHGVAEAIRRFVLAKE